jgi:preprotein translocase subunit SecG
MKRLVHVTQLAICFAVTTSLFAQSSGGGSSSSGSGSGSSGSSTGTGTSATYQMIQTRFTLAARLLVMAREHLSVAALSVTLH